MTTTAIGAASPASGLAGLAQALNDTGLRKNNWAATVAPTGSDNSSSGYEAGSLWLDTAAGILYVAKTSAGVWVSMGAPTGQITRGQLTARALGLGAF